MLKHVRAGRSSDHIIQENLKYYICLNGNIESDRTGVAMTSKVKVHMNVCDQVTEISVRDNQDGTYSVSFESDCENVKEFFQGLENIDLSDLSDKENSDIFDRMRESRMSATCLVPVGLLNAGWMEAGLLSKNLAKECGENTIEFIG